MPDQQDVEFADPASYPHMCVASPSCHDTSTTRAWWEEDAARRARFYTQARSPLPFAYVDEPGLAIVSLTI